MFCPSCKTILYPKDNELICKRCDYRKEKGGSMITSSAVDKKKTEVMEEIAGTLPTTVILCEKCGHNEASWILGQTRASDEPETRIYQCLKCKYKWREY